MRSPLEFKKTLAVASGVMFTISGLSFGYILGVNDTEAKYEDIIDDKIKAEVERVKTFYALRYKDFGPEEVSELDEVPEGGIVVDNVEYHIPSDMMETAEGRAEVKKMIETALEEKTIEVNAFNPDHAPQFDWALMQSERSGEKPYVISQEEYLRNDAGHEHYDLTYFDKDGVLMDDQDNSVPDIDDVIGDESVNMFGVMSNDNNVVYVQNDRSETAFRVTRSFGSASEAIFGPDADEDAILEHSSMTRRRPRRDDH